MFRIALQFEFKFPDGLVGLMRFQQQPAESKMQVWIIGEFCGQLGVLLFGLVKVVGGEQHFGFSYSFHDASAGRAVAGRLLGFHQECRKSHPRGEFLAPDMISGQLSKRFSGSAVFAGAQLQHSHVVKRHDA